jgi:cyclic pyranopterin phosphate synthase
MAQLTHFDDSGASRMVDVGGKEVSLRFARAEARVVMRPATLGLIRQGQLGKGNVLEVARLAGILAAKRTGELIPLCHTLPLDEVRIDFEFPADNQLRIETRSQVHGRTGVEMEALVAASTAALTVYDMCKSVDREMEITSVRLLEKAGGKSGHFLRESGASTAVGPSGPARQGT